MANDEARLEIEFQKVDETIKRQRYYIAKFLEIDEIPDDLSDDEWAEVLDISRERKDKIKEEVKQAKADGEFKDNDELVLKDKHLKDIIKLAKKEDITESRLFNAIQSFRDSFRRNEKLICLKLDNLPEHVTEAVLLEYNKNHEQSKQAEFLKFVRKHRLREFAFGQEWNTLKSIQNHD